MDAQTNGRRLEGLAKEPTLEQHQRAEANHQEEPRDEDPGYVHPLDRQEAKLLRAQREADMASGFRLI